jgi:tetratricopeptide (TPR) repeat protein
MKTDRWFAHLLAAMVVSAGFPIATYADDQAVIEAMFEQARKLERESKYKEAVAKYEQALTTALARFGQGYVNTAVIQHNLGGLYARLGQYSKAEPLLRRALGTYESKLGKNSISTARVLNDLANLSQDIGELKKAELLYLRALAIKEASFGKNHEEAALTLGNLGTVYEAMSLYSKAESIYLRAIAIYEDKPVKNQRAIAAVVQNLATVYQDLGQNKKAESLLRRALEIKETKLGVDHLETGMTVLNLANLYRETGKYEQAERLYQRALAIYQANVCKTHPIVAGILQNLAILYLELGQVAKAEPLHLEALAIRRAALSDNHPDIARIMLNLGTFYQSIGQYTKAEPLYQRALSIYEAKLGQDHVDTAGALDNLAGLYRLMGQYAKSERFYLRAIAIDEARLGKDHAKTGAALHNLALLYDVTHQYEKAEPILLRALAIAEEKLGEDHPTTIRAMNNLGGMYSDMGQFDKAEPLLLRALAKNEAKLGMDHPQTGGALNDLATLYRYKGEYTRAETFYLRSLAIQEAQYGTLHSRTANMVKNLALLYTAKSEWEKAGQYLERSRRMVRAFIGESMPVLSDQEQEIFLEQTDLTRFHECLSHGLLRRNHVFERNLSAGWLLNGKALAAQARADSALLIRDSRDPRVGQLAVQLAELRQKLAALTLRPGNETDVVARSKRIADLTTNEQNLARQLSQATGRGLNSAWIELADVRNALPPSSTLIEIARFDRKNLQWKPGDKYPLGERYVAWIIPPSGDIQIIDLGDAKRIDDAVAAVRKKLQIAQQAIRTMGEVLAEKEFREPLDALSRLVLHPLVPHVGAATTWIISPDSQLWLIPWSAMTLPDGMYASEKHVVRYVVSGRDLVSQKNTKVAPTAPMIFADPDFDMHPGEAVIAAGKTPLGQDRGNHRGGVTTKFNLGNVQRLPGTAAEAEAVAPKLAATFGSEPRVLTERRARVTEIRETENPRVLILSTHGFFLPKDQSQSIDETKVDSQPSQDRHATGPVSENVLLRCGLLLAGCNHYDEAKPGEDNGVLTGLEIVGSDLRGTELVVLSACETGLGDVRNGEGVAGLRQAFQLAGAESVVATLWQVADGESALLMAAFFDHLAKREARDEALRNAQLEMLQKRRARFGAAHPYFWAAYTLTGQAR